jgi:transcriptional regulator with XRE-family HTH domain
MMETSPRIRIRVCLIAAGCLGRFATERPPEMNDTTKITEPVSTIAVLLHAYMVEHGFREEDIALLIPCNQSQVGRWRRGLTIPRPDALATLGELLDIDTDALEGVRVESERVRAISTDRRKTGTADDIEAIKAELKASKARVALLEQRIIDGLRRN